MPETRNERRKSVSPQLATAAPRGFRARLQARAEAFLGVNDGFLFAADKLAEAVLCGQGRRAESLRVGFTVGRALGGRRAAQSDEAPVARSGAYGSVPQAPVAVDVVINPKKALLTVEFATVLNEVSRAFVVIRESGSRRARRFSRAGKARSRKADA